MNTEEKRHCHASIVQQETPLHPYSEAFLAKHLVEGPTILECQLRKQSVELVDKFDRAKN